MLLGSRKVIVIAQRHLTAWQELDISMFIFWRPRLDLLSLELSCSLQVVLWRHLLWRKHLIIEYDGVALTMFWVFACSMITIMLSCSLIIFYLPHFLWFRLLLFIFFNTYFREESEACGEQICDRELHQEVVHSRELKRFIIIMFSFLKGYHLQLSYSLLVKRFIIYN